MTDNLSDSPTIAPKRAWDDDPEVRVHLRFITKKHGDELLRKMLTEDCLCDASREDRTQAEFLNRIAGAYGHVDLISISGNCLVLDRGALEQLRTVLSPEYRGGM